MLKQLPDQDRKLQQLVSEGDKVAFAQLFDQYKDSLYYLTWSLTRSINICDDVLQETFLRVWIHRHKLAGVNNFPVYLAVIAKRVILNELRRAARIREKENMGGGECEEGYDDEILNNVESKQYESFLREAMKQLPGQQASVFKLIKLHGYTRHEAAIALGLAPETVKKHLERAMRTVREFLLTRLDNTACLFLLVFFSENSFNM